MLRMLSCQQHSMTVVVSKFQTVPQHITLSEGKCCSSIAVLSYQSAWSSETTLHSFWIARGNGNQGNSEQNTATVKGGWAGCFCCCYTFPSPQHALNHPQNKICSLVWEADFCLLKMPCASHPECWAFLLKNITSPCAVYRRAIFKI